VRKIVAGGNHTLVLMEDGRVFRAGGSGASDENLMVEFEQQNLDVGDREDGSELCRVTDVAATWEASFYVVNRSKVFVQGSGGKGELGLGDGVVATEKVTRVFDVDCLDDCLEEQDANIEIVDIAACVSHVVVLLSDGRVLGWGTCRKGELGEQYKDKKVLWEPTRVGAESTFNPERVVVGRQYTVCLRGGEKPLVWGEAEKQNEELFDLPLHAGDTVVSGWGAIHILSSGQVRSVGKNHRGQLAPEQLPTILALAAGSEHCVALTESNQVIAWGWGEHGNCGEEIDQKGNVVGRWNVISMPHPDDGWHITAVAAGCATSFVVCEETDPD
jgi:protein ATS1